MTISEKVSYLKGLAEGLELDAENSKEGRLISVMIGILEEIGLSIDEIQDNADELAEELDAVSDDLSDVEKIVYAGEDDEDEDDEEDEDFFEVECPSCGADIVIDQDVLDAGTVECPSCGEKFVLDLYDEEEDGGRCCHGRGHKGGGCGRWGGEEGRGCCRRQDGEEAPSPQEPEE